jgi:hypothetical protein
MEALDTSPAAARSWHMREIARHIAALQGREVTPTFEARVMVRLSAVLAECKAKTEAARAGRPVEDEEESDEPVGR